MLIRIQSIVAKVSMFEKTIMKSSTFLTCCVSPYHLSLTVKLSQLYEVNLLIKKIDK